MDYVGDQLAAVSCSSGCFQQCCRAAADTPRSAICPCLDVLSPVQVVVNTAAEEVLHLLPPVKTLRVVLVGPEFKVITTGPQVFKHFDKEVCPPCSRIGAKRILTIYR